MPGHVAPVKSDVYMPGKVRFQKVPWGEGVECSICRQGSGSLMCLPQCGFYGDKVRKSPMFYGGMVPGKGLGDLEDGARREIGQCAIQSHLTLSLALYWLTLK